MLISANSKEINPLNNIFCFFQLVHKLVSSGASFIKLFDEGNYLGLF